MLKNSCVVSYVYVFQMLYWEILFADLHDFPLGALRQAQRVLHLAEAESESDSERDSGIDSEAGPEVHDTKGKRKEKVERVEWSAKPRTDISKRSSKHAWVQFVPLWL